MSPTEMYQEVAIQFPGIWPQSPDWIWVNVHDGQAANLSAIAELLDRSIRSSEVVVVVHSSPGTAAVLSKTNAAKHIAQYVLEHDIQASDPEFTCYVSVSSTGVATAWDDKRKPLPSLPK